MATNTVTKKTLSQIPELKTDIERYVEAFVNYYQDSTASTSDPSLLSEHETRILRRRDDAPDVCPAQVCIQNMRSSLRPFAIDEHGFQIAHLASCVKDWSDPTVMKAVYFPEVTALLKELTGAKHVFQYEHHIRRRTLADALKQKSTGDVDINGPVRRLHIDETPVSAHREFEYWTNDAALRDRPFGIYNVWKPLKTVRKDPLCVCDARSLRQEDLRVGAVTVPHVGQIENYSIRAPGAEKEGRHQFWFQKGQRPDEALVFRIFDSRFVDDEQDCRRFGVAHTSFEDPATKEMIDPRESIEVRSFCVF